MLHITSQVASDPYQDLLSEKGGGGWPFFVALDADGNVLAKFPLVRGTIDLFSTTMRTASETQGKLEALAKKAKGGDQAAKIELFMTRMELSHFTIETAKAAYKKLGKIDDQATAKKLQTQLTGMEINEIMSSLRSAADWPGAAKKFVAIWKDGRAPEGSAALDFWALIISGSIRGKDKKTASEAIAVFEKRFSDDPNPRIRAYIKRQKAAIEKLSDGGK